MRQKVLAHTDACIRHGEAECGFSVVFRFLFYQQTDAAPLRRELHGIAQNIDQDLPEFHVVADIVVIGLSIDMAVVIQSFISALTAEHDIDGFQKFLE